MTMWEAMRAGQADWGGCVQATTPVNDVDGAAMPTAVFLLDPAGADDRRATWPQEPSRESIKTDEFMPRREVQRLAVHNCPNLCGTGALADGGIRRFRLEAETGMAGAWGTCAGERAVIRSSGCRWRERAEAVRQALGGCRRFATALILRV